jgi:hypothetical protein
VGARVSLSALLASTTLSGPARVSLSTLAVVNQLSGPIRVSGSYMLVARSISSGFEMNLLDSSSVIYGADSFDVTASAPPAPEPNPYKPIIPDSMREALGPDDFNYLQENQETLRQQHNLAQAGDTTFPYQLIITSHKIQQYKLGAVGRFYHEDYGIINARYVQFMDMVAVTTPQCPVGLFHKADSLEWVVTNDYSKSHPDLVVGISAPWTLAPNSNYGWVIVDGPILQQVVNNSTTFGIGEAFAWDASGSVSNSAAGKIVGRRVAKTDITRLPAGSMWVRTESYSEAQINAIITTSTQALLDELQALERQLATLPSAAILRQLQITVTSLRTTLSNEASARIAADLRLNERISNLGFITLGQLNAAVALATNEIAADLTNLTNEVAFIRDTLNLQTARIDALVGVEATLQSQLDSILGLIDILSHLKRNRFPVVDGSVPPNLVYLDDGSLVYTEE